MIEAAEAIARYTEAMTGKASALGKPMRVPNRAIIRQWRFGGDRVFVPESNGTPEFVMKPKRSRVQRGISRPVDRLPLPVVAFLERRGVEVPDA